MAVFSVEDLKVTFVQRDHQVEAVRGVSFSVDAGSTLAIVGESGSGKSVSLLASTGLLGAGAVVTGTARHDGTDLVGLGARELRRIRGREIGFVFQDPLTNLHPLKTIGEQLADAIRAHTRIPRAQVRQRGIELLDEVGIQDPRKRIDDYPVHFSGGMRQRAMIAAAIAHNPSLLIADEPTTSLDVTVQAAVLRLLERLQREHGMAMIFVSHDLAVVSDIADRVVVMREGRVVEEAATGAIYTRPEHPYTKSLLGATRHGLVRRAPGATRASGAGRTPRLAVSGLSHEFHRRLRRHQSHRVLDDVSFEIGTGEILGLVGESGSGKSTIGRVVAGLIRPTAGVVTLDGEAYNQPGRSLPRLSARTRAAIQVVFQDPYGSLNPRRRVGAILAEPFRLAGGPTQRDTRQAVAELLERVELPAELAQRYPAHLSGGQCQRVAIARALALNPSLVVADEPVSALDITTQQQILALVRRLRDELEISFLFISHDLSVVAELSDRVLVLSAGRVVEQGETAAVFANAQDPYTRLLLESIPGARRSPVRLAAPPDGEQEAAVV